MVSSEPHFKPCFLGLVCGFLISRRSSAKVPPMRFLTFVSLLVPFIASAKAFYLSLAEPGSHAKKVPSITEHPNSHRYKIHSSKSWDRRSFPSKFTDYCSDTNRKIHLCRKAKLILPLKKRSRSFRQESERHQENWKNNNSQEAPV